MEECPIARYYRDVRLYAIGGGASEIMRDMTVSPNAFSRVPTGSDPPAIRTAMRPTRQETTMQQHDRRATRRQFLQQGTGLAAAVGVPALALPGRASAQARRRRDFASQTLTALVYSGINENTWRKHFVQPFEEATGAKLVMDSFVDRRHRQAEDGAFEPGAVRHPHDRPDPGLSGDRRGALPQDRAQDIPNLQRFHKRILTGRVYEERWGIPFMSSAMTLAWKPRRF